MSVVMVQDHGLWTGCLILGLNIIDERGLNNTFTKRAFFNGKLDLTEVEGLAS